MFVGTFNHNIDDKKRLIMPAKFRNELGNEAVMTVGHDHSIAIYTSSEWNKLQEKLMAMNFNNSNARKYIRIIAGSACSFSLDSQGRVVLPLNLIKHSNIDKEVVLVGDLDHIELWSKENWDKYYNDSIEGFDDISEGLE